MISFIHVYINLAFILILNYDQEINHMTIIIFTINIHRNPRRSYLQYYILHMICQWWGGINSTFTQFIWFENYNDKKWAQKIWYSRHWNFHHEQSGLIKQCPLNLNAWQDFWPHEYFMYICILCVMPCERICFHSHM